MFECRKEFTTKQFPDQLSGDGHGEKVRASTSDCYVKNIEKQQEESLEAHRRRREDFITVLHRDQDKMKSVKRIGSELQARVQGEFQALQAFLAEEEACVLEQLRREQEEAVEQLQRHLEAVREAVRRLEHSMRVLQEAATTTHQTGLVELPQLRPPLEVDPGPELDLEVDPGPELDLEVDPGPELDLEKQQEESLEAHRRRREDFITVLHRDQDKMKSVKRIGSELQARVQGEFQALQAFLAEEEAVVLEQLRREQGGGCGTAAAPPGGRQRGCQAAGTQYEGPAGGCHPHASDWTSRASTATVSVNH
ncbi:hypothetical protein J4Q44_G00309060 [Coregonus suidteri]|uniref:Uncharacterized protein n=1 Tax=Coregonus suidteri TaxID=861788 RepID=A0AAN8L541_9TELE